MRKVCLFICCLFVFAMHASSQEKEEEEEKNFKFRPLPYLNYSRTGGFAIGAVPMAMYKIDKNDTISPASISGIGGLYTTEGNWGFFAFQRVYAFEDNWRFTLGAALGFRDFQFFDTNIGDFVDYSTDADFFMIKAERRIYKRVYLGLRYHYAQTETIFEGNPIPNTTIFNGLGLSLAQDLRDDVYYPYSGSLTQLKFNTNPEFLENEFTSEKLDLSYNKYIPMKNERDVLALRGMLGIGIGNLAFEQQFIVGQSDIRGYTQGEFRGENIMTLQGEYRYNLTEKLGLVGFGGIATVWQAPNEEHNGKLLPGAGFGVRFNVFPDNHMNIGLDAAVGDGDWGIYFRIGEAF